MLTTLLAAIAFQSPNLDKPVTLRTVAKPVAEVLKDVTTQVGFRFEASQVREWPIIVSVKDLPVGQVLDRIAEVTDSEWVKERDRWVLTRSAARVKKAAEIELADRAARLKPAVDALPTEMSDAEIEAAAAEIKKTFLEMKEYGGAVSQVGGPSPGVVLLNHILKRMPVAQLASMPISSYASFSTAPRPGQQQLAPIPSEGWSAYRKARERFAALVEIPNEFVSTTSWLRVPLTGQPRIVVGFARPNATANIECSILLLNASDQPVDVANLRLVPAPQPGATVASPTKGPIPLRAESRALLTALRLPPSAPAINMGVGSEFVLLDGVDPRRTPESQAVLRNAIEGEPMSYFASDWLLDLADRTGRQLVAHVPDHAFSTLAARADSAPDHDTLWGSLPGLGTSILLDANELVLKPRFFARADRYRVDRTALRQLVRAAGPYGLPPSQVLMDYAEKAPPVAHAIGMDTVLLNAVLHRTHAGTMSEGARVAAWRLLRAWRAVETSSDRLKLGQAQTQLQLPYDRFVRSFERRGVMNYTSSERTLPLPREFDAFEGPAMDPETPVVQIVSSKREGVLVARENAHALALGPGTLGAYLALKPENFSGFAPVQRILKMHPATIVSSDITFRSVDHGLEMALLDVSARLNESWTVDQLPVAWKGLMEQGRERGEMMHASVGPPGFRPPPP
jgi:hypothetical protein